MTTTTTRRTGGRRGRAAKRTTPATRAFDRAWRQWVRLYAPVEQFSADEIQAIHEASLTVLKELGIHVMSDEARALYVSAGMMEDPGEIIRFDPEALMELIAKAPSEITLHGRGRTLFKIRADIPPVSLFQLRTRFLAKGYRIFIFCIQAVNQTVCRQIS